MSEEAVGPRTLRTTSATTLCDESKRSPGGSGGTTHAPRDERLGHFVMTQHRVGGSGGATHAPHDERLGHFVMTQHQVGGSGGTTHAPHDKRLRHFVMTQ